MRKRRIDQNQKRFAEVLKYCMVNSVIQKQESGIIAFQIIILHKYKVYN